MGEAGEGERLKVPEVPDRGDRPRPDLPRPERCGAV